MSVKLVQAAAQPLARPSTSCLAVASSSFSARSFTSTPIPLAGARANKKAGSPSAKKLASSGKGGARSAAGAVDNESSALPLKEAFRVLRAWEATRPWSALTLTALVLPDKAKPSMRGRTNFARDPRTKPEVVYVFCKGGDVKVALGAGAAMAGGEELMEKILNGLVPLPTACLATPSVLPSLTSNRALTRLLGPKGLLPQAKRGTVVDDVAKAVGELKGVLDWRVSKQQVLQAAVGRTYFTASELEQNVLALVGDLRKCGTVAATFDGQDVNYTAITRLSLKSTCGPELILSDVLPKVLEQEAEALVSN